MRGKAALLRSMKVRSLVEGQSCAYGHRTCTQSRLDGYEFCLKHILEDKTSPFKHCSYVAPRTSRRCMGAAPKSDRKDGYCAEHAKKIVIARQRSSRKKRPPETAETLLEDLASSNASASESNAESKMTRHADSIASKVLEYASSSDSDMEVPSVDQAWRRDNDSDAESIDSDLEDPLKHAGVYSQEEVALLLRDKLIRLQSLYIEQFKRLQHVLREKRRKFLHAHKLEQELLGPIHAYKRDHSHHKKYERLQAVQRYHKFFGKEALLHQKCNLRRIAVAEGINYRPPTFPRCIAPSSDGRCNKRVVPLSKYCMQHILSDPHQVLFEACRFSNGQCGEPVFSLDVPLCRRHASLSSPPSSTATATQTKEPLEKQDENAEVCMGETQAIPVTGHSQDGMSTACTDISDVDLPQITASTIMSTDTDKAGTPLHHLAMFEDTFDSAHVTSSAWNDDVNMDMEEDLLRLVDGGLLGPVLT